MKVKLSLARDLVERARKIVRNRGTTWNELVREHLACLVRENPDVGGKLAEHDALERSFLKCKLKVGKRTWKRADLYTRG
jgi:hypothetical protein